MDKVSRRSKTEIHTYEGRSHRTARGAERTIKDNILNVMFYFSMLLMNRLKKRIKELPIKYQLNSKMTYLVVSL